MKTQTGSVSLFIIPLLLIGLMTLGYFFYHGQNDKQALNAQLNSVQQQLRRTQRQLREKEFSLNEQETRLFSLNNQRNQLKNEIDNIKQELDASQKNQQEAQQSLSQASQVLKNQLEGKEKEYEALTQSFKEKEDEYQKELVQLNEFSSTLNQKFQSTQEQLSSELERTKSYSFKVETLEERLQREQEALDQLKKQLNTLDKTNKKLSESNQQLSSVNKELDSEKNRLIKQFQDGITIIRLPDNVLFPSGSAQLNNNGKQTLAFVAKTLSSFPSHLISIEGHTDQQPITSSLTEKYPSNWELSSARSAVAIRYLTSKGLKPNQFQAVGFGSTRPIAKGVESHKKNRRIEILLYPPMPKNIVEPSNKGDVQPSDLPKNQISAN